jgi:hypothetical protein
VEAAVLAASRSTGSSLLRREQASAVGGRELRLMADSTARSAGRVFINYRRQETGYAAIPLFDRLADRYGRGQIFKDIDSIRLGDDFVKEITTAVGSCDVLLALIGEQWLTITDEHGRARLDNPQDFVRLELEAALTRDVRVIPILVAGARMPNADQLPPSLAKLVHRQALDLSPSHFDSDISRLLKVLDSILTKPRLRDRGLRQLSRRQLFFGAAVTSVALIVGIAIWLAHSSPGNRPGSTSEPPSTSATTPPPRVNHRAAIPPAYVGIWKGTASEASVLNFPVVLTIHSGKGGAIVGSSSTPTLGCTSQLTLIDSKSTAVTLSEHVTSNSGACVSDAIITLQLNEGKSLIYKETTGNALESATARLTRS